MTQAQASKVLKAASGQALASPMWSVRARAATARPTRHRTLAGSRAKTGLGVTGTELVPGMNRMLF